MIGVQSGKTFGGVLRFNWIHEINHYDERLMAWRDPVGSLITRRPTIGRPAIRSGKFKPRRGCRRG